MLLNFLFCLSYEEMRWNESFVDRPHTCHLSSLVLERAHILSAFIFYGNLFNGLDAQRYINKVIKISISGIPVYFLNRSWIFFNTKKIFFWKKKCGFFEFFSWTFSRCWSQFFRICNLGWVIFFKKLFF